MNLIVFDLEWNIGYQPKTFHYHDIELTLRGEIIQIGAVKIDLAGNVLDTFEMTLKPRIFRKMQYRIAQVTGLSQGDLEAGVPIVQGLASFKEWAGPDAEFAEWGLDDVPVLKQNLFLCGLDERWPAHWYDLQRVFLAQYPRGEGEGMTLESVVDRLGIPKEEPFHRALDDALYTVKVCRKLNLAAGLEAYPREDALLREGLLVDPEAQYYDVQTFFGHLGHDDYKNDPALTKVECPVCGHPLTPDAVWLKRGNTGYYTLVPCPEHGPWFLRFKLSRRDGLHWNIARCLEAPRPDTLERWNRQRAQYLERQKKREEKNSAAPAAQPVTRTP
ncbi:MAG: exonuclease domain-containing protein [Gemmiger sp.]|nr:exonuclease domain-containing protein [Gemmiger sp.]